MQQLFRKIKRVEPIIRMKRQKVDEEAAVLAAIRQEKMQIVASMKDSQRRYMDGYQELNKLRSSADRKNLATLESALDSVKGQWEKLRLEVERVELKERAQITHLLTAERDLRAVEKLKERYAGQINESTRRQEQKAMDEHALRRYLEGKG
jgi:flagellar export protein FliJ